MPDLEAWLAGQAPNPWTGLLREAVAEYALETGDSETPVESFIEWLAEWGREVRRRQHGLLLLTAHRAKGLEFDHVVVLDGDWARVGKDEDGDAPRRLYYVAMTRAMRTLTLMRLPGPHPFQDALTRAPDTFFRDASADPPGTGTGTVPQLPQVQPGRRFSQFRRISPTLGNLSTAAIAALSPGDPLQVRAGSGRWELLDQNGAVVGQLARNFQTSARYALRIRHGPGRRQVGPGALRAAVPGKPALRFLGGGGAGAGVPA